MSGHDDDIVDPTDAQIGDGSPDDDRDALGELLGDDDRLDAGGAGGFDRDGGAIDDLAAGLLDDDLLDGLDDDLADLDDLDDLADLDSSSDDRAEDDADGVGDLLVGDGDGDGLDDGVEDDDAGVGGAAVDGSVHLDLDGDLDGDVGSDDGTSGASESPAWSDHDLGVFGVDAIGGLAELAGGSVVGLSDVLEDLGLEADDLDARGSVRVLDALGVDARIEHGSIDRLVSHLADGGHVRIASAGRSFEIEEVDDRRDLVVVRGLGDDAAAGLRYEVPLEHLDDQWSAGSYEMIVSAAPGDAGLALVAVDLADVLARVVGEPDR